MRAQVIDKTRYTVTKTVIAVHHELPWLSATSKGVIESTNAICEIECSNVVHSKKKPISLRHSPRKNKPPLPTPCTPYLAITAINAAQQHGNGRAVLPAATPVTVADAADTFKAFRRHLTAAAKEALRNEERTSLSFRGHELHPATGGRGDEAF